LGGWDYCSSGSSGRSGNYRGKIASKAARATGSRRFCLCHFGIRRVLLFTYTTRPGCDCLWCLGDIWRVRNEVVL